MIRYILKRLLYMCATLFGIVVITFIITRIAPGDPSALKLQAAMTSAKSQPITKRMIDDNRKLYGFDKPILFNFREKGKDGSVKQILNEYLEEKDPAFYQKSLDELFILNWTAVPSIFNFLSEKKLEGEKKDALVQLLYKILAVNNPESSTFEEVKKKADEKLKKWTPSYLEDKMNLWIQNGSEEAKKDFLESGSLAVPYLIEKILSFETNKKKEIIEVLASLTKKPWVYDETLKTEEKNDLFYSISKYWSYEKEKYSDFSGFEKFFRVFTDTQFGIWIGKVITFDFDTSYAYKRPVSQLIKERLPVTLQLNLISMLLIYFLAFYVGIYSSTVHNTRKEKTITLLLFISYSLPSFWIANLLILFFTGGDFLNWFPSQYLHSPDAQTFTSWKYFTDWVWHMVLPVFVMTYGGLAFLSRQMKVSMLEALSQDYIRTARAKGLPENKVVYRHALRNALIPIITLMGGLLPSMLGGSVIVEEIFTLNGMGKLSFEAIMNRDYPVINAIAFFSAFLTLLGILISDLLYVAVDPRIKLEKIEM
ncbi:MAG TPA: hypothetical protein DHW82_12480 [Spirochaetia bacterium]|nr:MAG: hypothetical protein A2Y41_03895 [Spirochaetes bacterium GWB1_36_13]HCL57807.1 hypothetical protein [Spirochaetia bacterium]